MSEAEPLPQRLYRLLSDREFHSGSVLAARCGVSRSAVWKAVAALRGLGVGVHAVANRGYRLPAASGLIEAERVVALLPPPVAARLRDARSCWSTGSTNADLLLRSSVSAGQFDFLTAEYQSAGRGRRARRWFAPPGGALCLSLSWSFAILPPDIGALSLAIGVCALRALGSLGLAGAALKWPNDLVVGAGKLGGILIELRAEAGGPAQVVIGIGVNVALGPALIEQVRLTGTQAVDLSGLGADGCDRNRVAAALITASIEGLEQFQQAGFRPFFAEWRAADALAGKAVAVSADNGTVVGHARGIDVDGALCVQTREGLQRFVSGDVSVRAAA
ncbi:MAG TPA: biotin--[acetyl-CoA-carboxylase] ligase [Steroidobacteraceae bacterium]|jgi:BirA family biotin operon repressor/biotin-[acetyl-CoA-carboxylase] ligase|nr:biotin--[acetyl-CoA-carboxylase] ligase [Steroidobacteraceae bacterium]